MNLNNPLNAIKGQWLSVIFALIGIVFVWGQVLTNQAISIRYVMIILIGCAICIVHGVGWRPKHQWERFAFSPLLGWSILMLGFTLVLW